MERQVFLVRVNPKKWFGSKKYYNWDNLEVDTEVSFDGDCENYKHIQDIKLHDIFVGYNMNNPNKSSERNKSIVCIGRVISNGCFKSVGSNGKNSKRFLVHKVLELKNSLPLKWMRKHFKTLGVYQHTVLKLSKKDWNNIKKEVIDYEPEYEKLIKKLEKSWTHLGLLTYRD